MGFALTVSEIAQGIEGTLVDIERLEATLTGAGQGQVHCAQTRAFLRDLLRTVSPNLSPSTYGPLLARLNGDLPPAATEPTALDTVWILRVEGPADGQWQYLPKAFATKELAVIWATEKNEVLRLVGLFNIEPLALIVRKEK